VQAVFIGIYGEIIVQGGDIVVNIIRRIININEGKDERGGCIKSEYIIYIIRGGLIE
jgi:hypothetical protein